jgi:hypothetical protein
MKKSTCALNSTLLFSVLLSASGMVGCSNSNNSVPLRDNTAAPAPGQQNKPGEKPGAPTPTPTPGNPPTPIDEPKPTPTPTLVASRVARFICETQLSPSRSFNTLRGDSVNNFTMPSLVPAINGLKVNYVKSAVPLQSNGNTVFFVMRGQEDAFTPWKIYKATGNLLNSSASIQVLSNYEGIAPKGGYAFENLKMDRRILGANVKRSAYVYPNDSGVYVWESLKGSNFAIPFNANESFNPTFVGGDDYVRFDQENGGVLTQKFYQFDNKKTLSLPSPADSRDHQLFGYVNAAKTTIFWVEGRPDGQWKLRMAPLNALSKGTTLGTLPGIASSVRLPMAFLDFQGDTTLAYNEEVTDMDRNGLPTLKTAVIHLVKASAKQAQITSSKSVPYSDEIKSMAQNSTVLGGGILAGVFLEPISGQLYATNLAGGGLASFDPRSNTWSAHGMVSSSWGCYNPEWGVEVTNE